MSRNRLILFILALAAVLALLYGGDRARRKPLVAHARALDPLATLAGDPRAGERMYRRQCASCHGWSGDGTGPFADAIFPPRARDHTDGAYMNLRTDHELYDAVMQGGREVSRSRLMPSFKDSIDDLDAWNLVAYIRTLHPKIEDVWPQYSERQYHEVVLSPERAHRLGISRSARGVYYYSLHDSLGGISAYVLFPIVDFQGLKVPLAVAIGSDLEVARVRAHVRIEGAEVDSYLAGRREPSKIPLLDALRKEVELTALRLRSALEQHQDDQRMEKQLLDAFDERPQSLPRGQRLFLENCMACHGPMGRPTAFQRDYKPRNLADPEHMSRLDDGYLQAVIKHGGIPFNISPSMPAHPRLSPDELKELVDHIRSLSR